MRIGIVASLYNDRAPSGENRAVLDQVALLRERGNDVELYSYQTNARSFLPIEQVRAGIRVATGKGRRPLKKTSANALDVLHIHNLFPNFGTDWISKIDVPIASTLHNFRPLCAQGNFLRNGQTCFRCVEHSSFESLRNACYRGSSLRSIPLAMSTARPFAANSILSASDSLITLNNSRAEVLERVGVGKKYIDVVPNFSAHEEPSKPPRGQEYWVLIGRVGSEKGANLIQEYWPSDIQLKIIGPVEEEFRSTISSNVELLGMLSEEQTRKTLLQSMGLVSFSMREGSPISVLNALAAGRPVVAVSNEPEFDWAREYTPLRFATPRELRARIDSVAENWELHSQAAFDSYHASFNADHWYEKTLRIYEKIRK